MRTVVILVCFSAGILYRLTSAAPLPTPISTRWSKQNDQVLSEEDVLNKLRQYGHWKNKRNKTRTNKDWSSALKSLQQYGGIKETGVLDDDTVGLLKRPRCGVADVPNLLRRRKRYALFGTQWQQGLLYYRSQSYTARMSSNDQNSAFAYAFSKWSAVVPLTFKKTYSTSQANIQILFASGAHGDGFPFDGRGGVLAHTFAPTDGRMHFDEDEYWTNGVNNPGTIDLRQVATHEAGHSIGLGHSPIPGAVMFAYYPGFSREVTLTQDDIDGAQSLYGEAVGFVPPDQNNDSQSSSTTTSTTTTTTPPTTMIDDSTIPPTDPSSPSSSLASTNAFKLQETPTISRKNTPLRTTMIRS